LENSKSPFKNLATQLPVPNPRKQKPTMTKPAAAHARAMEVNNNQHDVTLNAHKVRFDFPFNDRDAIPQAPKILHSIFRRLVDSAGDIEFRDVNNTVVDLDNFPQDKSTFDTKFNTTVSDQRQRHILLVVELRSDKTFYALKQLVWSLLSKHNVFMKQHSLGLHQVDVCSPGWLSRTNPTYHSKERTKDDIYLHSTRAIDDFTDEIKQELVDNFPEYITHDNTFEIPEFHLVHRNIVGKGSQGKFETEAFEVQIERQHSKVFKHLMELTFANTSAEHMLFIPFSLKRELSGDEYCTILQQQNTYLENHRNIAIVGIGHSRMHQPVRYQDVVTPFDHLLRSKLGIYRVDSTKRTPDLGKWNISTDKEHYAELTTWIDSNITAFFDLVPLNDEEPMDEFPSPRRLSRSPARAKPASSSSSYTQKLQTAFITGQPPQPAPSKPRRTAWNRLPIDIQYENSTNEDFPPLPTKHNSDETRSTASSTRLTFNDDSIQKAIADSKSEWQAETKKFQDEIRESNKDLKTSIKIMIDESLSIQVKKIVNATVTEFGNNANLSQHFITRQELQGIVQSFTLEMTRQIQELQKHDTPTRKPPSAKRQQMSPDSPNVFEYGTPSTAMDADNDDTHHARGLSFDNAYDTPPREGSKQV
jgi:hypothetical protein